VSARPAWVPHLRAIGLAAVVGVVVAVALQKARQPVHPAYVICLVLAAVALSRLLLVVQATDEPPPPVAVEDVPEPAPYRDLVFLEERMSWGSVDRQRFEERVRPQLVRVTAERLRQRHGVSLADEPTRARAIVGEELWTFLTAPAGQQGKPIGHREMSALVGRIEAL
jgi:hypothetical protein